MGVYISHLASVLGDVEELQGVSPKLVLHLSAGRVHSTIDGGVAGAGILINEDDVPFLILMCKVNLFWRQRPKLIVHVGRLCDRGMLAKSF